jgi:hypothetical protein
MDDQIRQLIDAGTLKPDFRYAIDPSNRGIAIGVAEGPESHSNFLQEWICVFRIDNSIAFAAT